VCGRKSKNFYVYRPEYCKSGAFSRHGGGGGDFYNALMQNARQLRLLVEFPGVVLN